MFRKLATGFGVAVVAIGAAISLAGPASASPAADAHQASAQGGWQAVAKWDGTGNDAEKGCDDFRKAFFPDNGDCQHIGGNTYLMIPA